MVMIVEDRPFEWKRPLEELLAFAFSMGIKINEVTIPKTIRVVEDIKNLPDMFESDFGEVKLKFK